MKEAIIQYNDIPSGGYLAIGWKPLVRCKDCINYGNNGCRLKRMAYQTAPDWYCADGERRESGNDN